MTLVDFEHAAVLVTGGTRGLGKAIGLEFGRAGASAILTHRWGSVDEAELSAEFARERLPAPWIVESDVSDPEATRALMEAIRERGTRLQVLVNNVAFAQVVKGIDDLKRASLDLSLRYSAWPVLDYLRASRDVLGYYPRHVLAITTDGGSICHPGYDMVGVAKAALETLCRYLALHLRPEGVRVNAVRCGPVDTASLHSTFGEPTLDAIPLHLRRLMIDPCAVGRACVALCSGLMDGVTGQVITVDEGLSLLSPVTYVTGRGVPGPLA